MILYHKLRLHEGSMAMARDVVVTVHMVFDYGILQCWLHLLVKSSFKQSLLR